MNRLTQILQNTFLRVEGFLSVIFQSIFGFFGNLFGTFSKVAGLNQSSYFLESNPGEDIPQSVEKQSKETPQNATVASFNSPRRRPNNTMDYYLKMARDIKK